MHIIARPALAAIRKHADAAAWLRQWWKIAARERWQSLQAVRAIYPATDQVRCCLVFDVRGNKYRLICRVSYSNEWQRGTLLIKAFLTHAKYMKNTWKADCE
jgi:mRNA interferase HigB